MIWQAIETVVSFFEIYVILSFFYRRLESRVPRTVTVVVSVFSVLCQHVVKLLGVSGFFYILYSVAVCFLLTLLCSASWKQRIFYPLVVVSLALVADIAAGLILAGILGVAVDAFILSPHDAVFLIGSITAKLLFFVFVRIIDRLHTVNDAALPLRHWLIVMCVPAMSVVVNLGLGLASGSYIMQDPLAPFLILSGMLGINMLTFYMYDELSAQSRLLVEQERAKNRIEADIRQYKVIIEQSKEFAALLHDTRKHREVVYDLLVAGDSAAAVSYVKGLLSSESLLYHDAVVKSNPAVDMLLRRKIAQAAQDSIRVLCNFEAHVSLPVDDISLCLIFGNALDNAIEACRKLPAGRDRFIEIDVRCSIDRFTIRIANTSEPVRIVNNRCVSAKHPSLLHGYGLPNLQKTVLDQGGNSVIRYDDGVFVLCVLFLG